MREVLALAPAPDAAALARAKAAASSVAVDGATRLVLVDGVFAAELSDTADLEPGVSMRSLREVLENPANEARADLLLSRASDAMISLNGALATDGLVIGVS